MTHTSVAVTSPEKQGTTDIAVLPSTAQQGQRLQGTSSWVRGRVSPQQCWGGHRVANRGPRPATRAVTQGGLLTYSNCFKRHHLHIPGRDDKASQILVGLFHFITAQCFYFECFCSYSKAKAS